MSGIATLLTIALIGIALRLEFTRKDRVSWAVLWLPLLWLFIVSSRELSQWLHIGTPLDPLKGYEYDPLVEGNPLNATFHLAVFLLGLAILMGKRNTVLELLAKNKWLTALYMYCLISTVWSDFPFVALKRLIKDACALVMVLIVLTQKEPFDSFKSLVRSSTYILMPVSVMLIKYFPALGRSYSKSWSQMYHGVATHKNSLGIICVVGGLVLLVSMLQDLRERKDSFDKVRFGLDSLIMSMILYLLWMSDSKTSQMCFLSGTLLLTVFSFVLSLMKRPGLMLIGLFASALAYYASINLSSILELVGRNATLTGRTGLWATVISMSNNEILGTGYRSFWSGERLIELWQSGFELKQAHNGYIEVYINLGILGLSALAATICSTYRKLTSPDFLEEPRYRYFGNFVFVFFFLFLIHNFTEATILSKSPLWFTFLFVLLVRRPVWSAGGLVPRSVPS